MRWIGSKARGHQSLRANMWGMQVNGCVCVRAFMQIDVVVIVPRGSSSSECISLQSLNQHRASHTFAPTTTMPEARFIFVRHDRVLSRMRYKWILIKNRLDVTHFIYLKAIGSFFPPVRSILTNGDSECEERTSENQRNAWAIHTHWPSSIYFLRANTVEEKNLIVCRGKASIPAVTPTAFTIICFAIFATLRIEHGVDKSACGDILVPPREFMATWQTARWYANRYESTEHCNWFANKFILIAFPFKPCT